MSSQLSQSIQSEKQKGTCPICFDSDICIIARSGALRKHGHGGDRPMCAGSYGPPCASSAASADSQASASASGAGMVGASATQSRDIAAAGAAPGSVVFDLQRPNVGVLKWIPKGARIAASNLL